MSENNVSDGAAAVPAWQERKNLLLAGAVGLAVVLVAGYFLLFSGSSEESYEPIPSAAQAAAAKGGAGAKGAPAASAAPVAKPTSTVVPVVYDEDVFGNPFKPFYPPAPTGSGAAAAPAS